MKRAQGKNTEAESPLSQALAIGEKSLGPDHPTVAETATRLAGLYYTEGKYQQAAPLFERAFKNLAHQFQYNFTYMSEQDKLSFVETVRGVFSLYLSFCFQYRDRIPGVAGTMYDIVLLEKGLVAESVASFRARVATNGDSQTVQLLNQIAAARAEVARLRADPALITPESGEKADQIEQGANQAERELVKLSSVAAERSRISSITWRDVQKSLAPGEAAVEFVRFTQEDGVRRTGAAPYVVFVLTSANTSSPSLVYLGDAAEIETNVLQDYWHRVEESDVPGSGIRFYQKLWKPLEPKLTGARRVYVAPDGLLNQISFAAVPTDHGRLLIEDFDIRIVLSTKDLLRHKQPAVTRTAVLIGDPKFDLSEAEQRTAMAQGHAARGDANRKAQFKTTNVKLLRSSDEAQGALPRLPATGDEVRSIGRLMETSGWQVDVATGSKALKQTIEQVNGPRVLHVATHGFFDRDTARIGSSEQAENAMLHSGLFFAGANRALRGAASPEDLDDGTLTAYEATSLNLQGTELVVLSACETGLGESLSGEGVFGLRRALQEAGAQAILMSMWKVPDTETQILMTSFYKKWLSGMDKHTALNQAQLELRKNVMNRWQEERPHDWAAFVLVGP